MSSESSGWRRKLAWKVAAGFVVALLIVAGAWMFAPADRSWPETKRALEARGEVLDWEKFIPPAVSNEENFFADPVAANLLPLKGVPTPVNPLDVPSPGFPPNSYRLGVPFGMSNLVSLARAAKREKEMSLAELEEWFAQWDESFARLREAGRRPKARLPGAYFSPSDSPILNFVMMRTLAQVLASRGKVHLMLGKSAEAFEDLETLEVVMKACETQPATLVTAMIHVAIAGLYLETIEEGLRHKLWADPELKKIATRLAEMNLVAVVKDGIRAERAAVLRHLTALAERKRDPLYQSTVAIFTSGEWTVEKAVAQFAPGSWVRRNQAQYARIIQGYLDAMDAGQRMVDQTRIDEQNAEVAKLNSRWSAKNAILMFVMPNFSKAVDTGAKNQTKACQLAVACALERFRARHGSYPEKLEELVPEYIEMIPTDVYSGNVIQYESKEEGYELFEADRKVSHLKDAGNFIWQGN